MEKGKLSVIFESLLKEGFNVKKHGHNHNIHFDYLTIDFLSKLHPTREYQFIVRVQSQKEISQLVILESNKSIGQIIYPFPHVVAEKHVGETSRLLNLINKVTPLPCFGYDEAEKKCYYKYCFLTEHDDSLSQSASSTIEIMPAILDLYFDTIEQVSRGERLVQDLINLKS